MNLELEIFNNGLTSWCVAIGVALAINIAVASVKLFIIRRFSAAAKRTATRLDDALVAVVKGVRQWLILLIALYIGNRYLQLPGKVDSSLRAVAIVAAFLQFGLWGEALLNLYFNRSRDNAMCENAAAATGLSALGIIARTVLWAIVVLLALDNLGVNVTALVAGLGISGIAIALAVQNILGDLLASLSIVIDKPFVIGDFIVVDDCAGSVEHVGLKTTRVRSLSGEQLVFANSDLLKARLRNYKRMNERRILFGFGVLYQTSGAQLEQIAGTVRAIIEAQPLVRFERAHFKSFGDSSFNFEVVYWMLDPDYNKYMDTQQAINLALVRVFAETGIEFAYPTRTLFVEGPISFKSVDVAAGAALTEGR